MAENNATLDRDAKFGYLNGQPIALPECKEGESVDICSRCCRTFVVSRAGIAALNCQDKECVIK